MKIIFTEEKERTHHRARSLRGGLIKNYHKVIVLKSLDKIPSADFWFHGITHDIKEPISGRLQARMEEFKGKLVFFGNDDPLSFPLERIPLSIQNKVSLYLRSCWPSDTGKIDSKIKDRIGFVNPFLKPSALMPGKQIKDRDIAVGFYGALTAESCFDRVMAIRMLKVAGLPFEGGLYKISSEIPPADLEVSKLPLKKYFKTLNNTKLGLVLHGYNPLSFRLFECLATRCLAIVQDLSSVKFIDCDLKPGIHYVAIHRDLSDLVQKVSYYLKNVEEAQAIADAGFLHFKKMFQFTGVNLPQPIYERMVESWKTTGFPKMGKVTAIGIIYRMFLPFIHSI
jgi:hypothetical protein